MENILPHPTHSIPLIRSITNNKWHSGIDYLQKNVSESYSVVGRHKHWTYIVRRINDIFYCETYNHSQCADRVKYIC